MNVEELRTPYLPHWVRRRLARARISSRALPDTVLFVCRANLCRSPYAAAALRRALADTQCANLTIESGGFLTETREVPASVVSAAERRHVDLRDHRSTALSRARVHEADLIVVVEPEQVRLLRVCFGEFDAPVLTLGDVDPDGTGERAIHDPMTRPGCTFDETYERIDRCVAELARLLIARAN